MNTKELLADYLKDTKDDHFNFVKEKDFSVSTGSLTFDIEINGGIKPSILRFCGVSGGGKTSSALSIMNNFLKMPKTKGLYVKAEGRLSKEVKDRSGVNFVDSAVDWEEGTCFVFKCNVYETVANLIDKLINKNEDDVQFYFILDSMDSLIPKGDYSKTFEESVKVSGGAVLSAHFLRKMSLPLSVGGHICGMMSQVRSTIKINQYAKEDPRLTNGSGGNALQHYPDWIFEFQPRYKGDLILETVNGKETIVGHWAKLIFQKATNEKEKAEIRYPIRHNTKGGNAVWIELEIADLMLSWEFAKKSGAWIHIEPSLLEEMKGKKIEFPTKLHGMPNFYQELKDNPEASQFLLKKFKDTLLEIQNA